MFLTQSIKRNAQLNRNWVAAICGDRQRTWSEFVDRVSRLAGAIKELEVGENERIAILALNSDRYLEFCFATWWAGAVVVPMNIRWSPAENAYSLNDSGADVLFVDDQFLPQVSAIVSKVKGLRSVVYMGDGETPEGLLNYEQFVAQAESVEDAGRGGEDLAGLFYTGGTTGLCFRSCGNS